MARENIETVRRWFAPLSADSTELSEVMSELWDATGDYYPVPKFPEAHPCHGPAHLFAIRNGKIIRWQNFLDSSGAVEAARLPE